MNSCQWPGNSLLMRDYHDNEWCVPSYDDTYIFEMLTLEGAQSGLSWSIVLSKREEYRKAFHNFDIHYCCQLNDEQIEKIRDDYNVIKHSLKLRSVRNNALEIIKIQNEFGSFAKYLWDHVDCKPIVNNWQHEEEIPAQTLLSQQLSKDLKKRNFKFVGPVIIYSFMQGIGMVDDHIKRCPYHSSNR